MIESTKWAFWTVAILVMLTLVGWALRPVSMRVEREVMVQSHQYMEGKAERVAILEASLAEVEARLSSAEIPQRGVAILSLVKAKTPKAKAA